MILQDSFRVVVYQTSRQHFVIPNDAHISRRSFDVFWQQGPSHTRTRMRRHTCPSLPAEHPPPPLLLLPPARSAASRRAPAPCRLVAPWLPVALLLLPPARGGGQIGGGRGGGERWCDCQAAGKSGCRGQTGYVWMAGGSAATRGERRAECALITGFRVDWVMERAGRRLQRTACPDTAPDRF